MHVDRGARHRAVGLNAARRARHEAAQFDGRFRRNGDLRRFAAGDEFVDLAERARMKRRLAVVDGAEHQVGGALERRTIRGDAGRRARLADEAAIGLGVFVDAVAAQCQERGAWRHLAVALVQPAQERTAAVELTAGQIVPIEDAMVGNAAQHGVADIGAAAVLDIAANRIAAARIADQRDACRPGAAFQFLDGLAEFAALVLGRGPVGLRHRIVGSRQRIGEIDRQHPVARNPVRFHPPQRGDPQRGVIAIAMHEQNGRNLRRRGGGGRRLREGRQAEGAGRQGKALAPFSSIRRDMLMW